MSKSDSNKLKRRDAIKLMVAAAASPAVIARGQETPASARPVRTLSDPNLISPEIHWDKVLTDDELNTLSSLCDFIIPADSRSPSASEVGVPDFINEWVSAPYPAHENDQRIIRGGLTWLNAESTERFGREFRELTGTEKAAICNEIKWTQTAAPERRSQSLFFATVRDLASTGFFTSAEGVKDLGYRGNQIQLSYDSLPPQVEASVAEIAAELGLE